MDVLLLSDGTKEIVGSPKDFSDLIDRKLGMDARDWFDKLLGELDFYRANYVSSIEDDLR